VEEVLDINEIDPQIMRPAVNSVTLNNFYQGKKKQTRTKEETKKKGKNDKS
jgi:hypothetical protein